MDPFGYRERMLRRRLVAPLIAALAALALAACTPGGGVPTPTPTELTEEQAFAEAEGAFRAYIDAQNAVDTSDPNTFEPLFQLSSGEQNAFDRRLYSTYFAEGYVVSGTQEVTLIAVRSAGSGLSSIELDVCLDVSGVDIRNSSGESVVQPDRPPVQSLSATISQENEIWKVQQITGREGDPSC